MVSSSSGGDLAPQDGVSSLKNPAADRIVAASEELVVTATNPEISQEERDKAIRALGKLAGEMSRAALTDHLTGLPNTRALEHDLTWWNIHGKIVEHTAAETPALPAKPAKRMGAKAVERRVQVAAPFISVGVVDLDNFKAGNDTLGHDTMNDVLKEVSIRLSQLCREGDALYRTGGDEFSYLLQSALDLLEFRARMQSVVEDITGQYPILGNLHFGISFGVVRFDPRLHQNFTDIHRAADLAMYQEKRQKAAARRRDARRAKFRRVTPD